MVTNTTKFFLQHCFQQVVYPVTSKSLSTAMQFQTFSLVDIICKMLFLYNYFQSTNQANFFFFCMRTLSNFLPLISPLLILQKKSGKRNSSTLNCTKNAKQFSKMLLFLLLAAQVHSVKHLFVLFCSITNHVVLLFFHAMN